MYVSTPRRSTHFLGCSGCAGVFDSSHSRGHQGQVLIFCKQLQHTLIDDLMRLACFNIYSVYVLYVYLQNFTLKVVPWGRNCDDHFYMFISRCGNGAQKG